MRLLLACATLASLSIPSSRAFAQTAFIEGYVFNKGTGIPLRNAVVRVVDAFTEGPTALELAFGITDANGFYQVEVDEFLGQPVIIQIFCATSRGQVQGRSSARLREGLIGRNVYLEGSRYLTRCREP